MEVLTDTRFYLTPEQLKAQAADDWQRTLTAMEVEQVVVNEHAAQLTAQLRSLEQCTPATRHDETVIAIDRVRVADQLDHKKTRLVDIADAIAAHRKARP